MRRQAAWVRLALPALIFAASAAAFWPAARAGFVNWDDELVVTENHAFRGFGPRELGWMASTSWAGHYQPLTWLSFAVDHARVGLTPPHYPEAAAFHRTNLWLHAAGAVALYLLALALLPRAVPGPHADGRLAAAAALAALVHAVHPLRCESVCWVTERRDVLSGLCFALALWAWLRAVAGAGAPARFARRPLAAALAAAAACLALFFTSVSTRDPARLAFAGAGPAGLALAAVLFGICAAASLRAAAPRLAPGWAAACLALLLASLLSKAWGIAMPALLLILDAWPLRRWRPAGPGFGRALAAAAPLLLEKLPFWVLTLAFARLAQWAQSAQQGALDVWAIHTAGERIAQAAWGIAFYPWKTLVPTGLAPLYPIPDDLGLGEPRFLAAALAVLAVTAGLVALARRFPAGLAAFAAYVAMVSPVLGLAQSGPQLVADRYSYLAALPFAWLAGGLLLAARRRAGLAHALALVLVLALAGLSIRQSQVWVSAEALWTRALQRSPDSPLARLNLGLVRVGQARDASDPAERRARLDEAAALIEAAALRRPGDPLYQINRAALWAERALDAPPAEGAARLERAESLARSAVEGAEARGLPDASYHWYHGRIRLQAGRLPEAIESFARAVRLRPRWPAARLALGGARLESARLAAEREPERALRELEDAAAELRAAGSDSPQAWFLLGSARDLEGQILAQLGRPEQAQAARRGAAEAYARVPEADPRGPRARERLRVLAAGAAGEP